MPDETRSADGRRIPPQDLDESRLDAARRRREAEGKPSLGDEAIAHAQSIPDHHEPGGDEAKLNSGRASENVGEIARKGSQRADSAAQVGKPIPPGRTRE
jgi:hypothetical protein